MYFLGPLSSYQGDGSDPTAMFYLPCDRLGASETISSVTVTSGDDDITISEEAETTTAITFEGQSYAAGHAIEFRATATAAMNKEVVITATYETDLSNSDTVDATLLVVSELGDSGTSTYGWTYMMLKTHLADWLGLSRNTEGFGDDWDQSDMHRLDEAIRHGYWRFLYNPILPNENTAHRWSFLRPTGTFDTEASDYLYDMDADFGSLVGDIYYDSSEDIQRVLKRTNPAYIDRQRSINDAEGRPTLYAIRPKAFSTSAEQVQECMLYPTPDSAYTLLYHYDARFIELSLQYPYPLGGQAHRDTILQSCRDVATQFFREGDLALREAEHRLYLERLQASVEQDRRNSPDFLGYNKDHTRLVVKRHGVDFTCSLSNNLGGG